MCTRSQGISRGNSGRRSGSAGGCCASGVSWRVPAARCIASASRLCFCGTSAGSQACQVRGARTRHGSNCHLASHAAWAVNPAHVPRGPPCMSALAAARARSAGSRRTSRWRCKDPSCLLEGKAVSGTDTSLPPPCSTSCTAGRQQGLIGDEQGPHSPIKWGCGCRHPFTAPWPQRPPPTCAKPTKSSGAALFWLKT
jgi:hypothetical protein